MSPKYSSQTEGARLQPKLLSTQTLVYQSKMLIPLKSLYQAKMPLEFLLKVCKISPCSRVKLAGEGACHNVTHLSWASRWMFNSSGGYASCGYITADH